MTGSSNKETLGGSAEGTSPHGLGWASSWRQRENFVTGGGGGPGDFKEAKSEQQGVVRQGRLLALGGTYNGVIIKVT